MIAIFNDRPARLQWYFRLSRRPDRTARDGGRLVQSSVLEEVWFARDSPLEGDGFEPSVPRLGDLSYHAGSRLRDEILGPENDRCAVGRAFGSAIPGGTVNSFGQQRAKCVIDPASFAGLGASSKVAPIAPSNTRAAPAARGSDPFPRCRRSGVHLLACITPEQVMSPGAITVPQRRQSAHHRSVK